MPSYLVETFLARGAANERAQRERRAGEAAEALTREGTRVRFGGSIHVPDDEIASSASRRRRATPQRSSRSAPA